MSEPNVKITGFAKRLVDSQHIDEPSLLSLMQAAQRHQQSWLSLLIQSKHISARTLAMLVASDFGLPCLDLDSFDLQLLPLKYFHEKLISKYQALPLYQRGTYLYVALSDPNHIDALHAFAFHTSQKCLGIIVEADKLIQLIDKIQRRQAENQLKRISNDENNTPVLKALGPPTHIQSGQTFDADTPLVSFVNQLLLDAIKQGVSDLHFEPYESHYRIRFRRDGILYQAATPPAAIAPRISARIKVMAKLDMTERRLPQDGHFAITLEDAQQIHCRVSTCPTSSGEKIVVRVLDPSKSMLAMEALGYSLSQYHLLMRTLTYTQGMILVVGPTGSGKTVSLYAALNVLNDDTRNIMSIEDPVEIDLPGINQANVNIKAGFGFSHALRAFLRQDPDVIMVGEIRDLETADIAIKAAQTGHLVLSTLHTYSAVGTLTRFINMGIAPYHIASTVKLIIAQRLVRRLCLACRQTETLNIAQRVPLGFTWLEAQTAIFQANTAGCEHCHAGFRGQIGLYEMLEISEHLSTAIFEGAHTQTLDKLAMDAGMQTLRRAGINQVLAGLTSIAEILRVTEV